MDSLHLCFPGDEPSEEQLQRRRRPRDPVAAAATTQAACGASTSGSDSPSSFASGRWPSSRTASARLRSASEVAGGVRLDARGSELDEAGVAAVGHEAARLAEEGSRESVPSVSAASSSGGGVDVSTSRAAAEARVRSDASCASERAVERANGCWTEPPLCLRDLVGSE
nr:unnamed protein product [Digitaria exilis]